MFKTILTNVLTALYQPFWFSLLLSVLFMFFLLYACEHGWRDSCKVWIEKLKTSPFFRRTFLLAFCTGLILFRTLLNRSVQQNPLANVVGNWWILKDTGGWNTEPIENMLMMAPFTALLLWTAGANEKMSRMLLKDRKLVGLLWQSMKIGFLFSFTIEFLQLIFFLGTWQLSDIFYNTIGGGIGGLFYWAVYRIKCLGKKPQRVDHGME